MTRITNKTVNYFPFLSKACRDWSNLGDWTNLKTANLFAHDYFDNVRFHAPNGTFIDEADLFTQMMGRGATCGGQGGLH